MRHFAIIFAVLLASAASLRGGDQPNPPATQPYEAMLYELGAFPVAKLTKPYWTNGNPGQVYGKGERLDVDGWLPPYWTPMHLTDAEEAQEAAELRTVCDDARR